jgi:hypothetical protein
MENPMRTLHKDMRRHFDGSIDIDFYRQQVLMERRIVMTGFFKGFGPVVKPLVGVGRPVVTEFELAVESHKSASMRPFRSWIQLRAMVKPLRTFVFQRGAQASERLTKGGDQLWRGFAKQLIWAMAGWRHAKAVKMREYPTSRWSDQVEREINNQIIYGDPRGGNRQW